MLLIVDGPSPMKNLCKPFKRFTLIRAHLTNIVPQLLSIVNIILKNTFKFVYYIVIYDYYHHNFTFRLKKISYMTILDTVYFQLQFYALLKTH